MPYIEVLQSGKLVRRQYVPPERAARGCVLRLANIGRLCLRVGESKTVGSCEIRVVPDDAVPQTAPAPAVGSPPVRTASTEARLAAAAVAGEAAPPPRETAGPEAESSDAGAVGPAERPDRRRPWLAVRIGVLAAALVLLAYAIYRIAVPGGPPVDEGPLTRDRFVVYLMIGHSNMDGRSRDPDLEPHPRAWRYASGREVPWVLAVDGKRGGPFMPMLKGLAEVYPDRYFAVIHRGVSGGSIVKHFRRGERRYDELIKAAREIRPHATLGGVLSMLGRIESKKQDMAERFGDDYAAMIREFREDLDDPTLPFVVTQIEAESPRREKYQDPIEAGIAALPERLPHVAVIPTDGLPLTDATHFNTEGYRGWAERVVRTVRRRRWVPRRRDPTPLPYELASLLESGTLLATDDPGDPCRVVARVTRTSTPLAPADIAPYREALICTEYEVVRRIEGRLRGKRLLARQLALEDGRLLPPAEYEVGDVHELTVWPWDSLERFHSLPVADEVSSLEDELYYVFASRPAPQPAE